MYYIKTYICECFHSSRCFNNIVLVKYWTAVLVVVDMGQDHQGQSPTPSYSWVKFNYHSLKLVTHSCVNALVRQCVNGRVINIHCSVFYFWQMRMTDVFWNMFKNTSSGTVYVYNTSVNALRDQRIDAAMCHQLKELGSSGMFEE